MSRYCSGKDKESISPSSYEEDEEKREKEKGERGKGEKEKGEKEKGREVDRKKRILLGTNGPSQYDANVWNSTGMLYTI